MTVATDEIYEKYLQKAITEINALGDEVAQAGAGTRVPVVGAGHPLAPVRVALTVELASQLGVLSEFSQRQIEFGVPEPCALEQRGEPSRRLRSGVVVRIGMSLTMPAPWAATDDMPKVPKWCDSSSASPGGVA